MKYLFVLILILSSGISTCAQGFDRNKMDSLFNFIDAHDKGMGSISLYQDGKEVYARTIGYADVEHHIKATDVTKYRIGSISKTFTATLIMQLVEDRKLSLDTKLKKFFPQLPNADKITIEHLLRHRSGLYNYTNKPDFRNWMDQAKSEAELLEIFLQNGSDFEPGEKFAYSNTNYVLLSFIAEKVEGMPFADLNKFLIALFSGKLVSKSTLKQMTKLVESYGIGLIQIPFYQKKAYGHNGRIDEFYAMIAYFPEDYFAITYLSNGIVMPVNDIMIAALSIYFDREYTLPDFKPGLTLSPEVLEQYLGTYSSPGFPLKVSITKEGSTLIGQATGQASFHLQAIDDHIFQYQQAGLVLEFVPGENLMVLKQGGGENQLRKE